MKKLMIIGGLVALGTIYLKNKVHIEVVKEDIEDGKELYDDLHDAIARVEQFEQRMRV